MRARTLCCAALALALLCGCARAEYWRDAAEHPIKCREDRPGCLVMQTVMMGSFDDFDARDSLSARVLSAALPRLCAVTEEDFAHFEDEFDVEDDVARRSYHVALGNSLWADILLSPGADDANAANARRVLRLFLAPTSEPNGLEQMATIRYSMNDEKIKTLADAAGLPLAFVEYLIYSDDWYHTKVVKD